MEYRFEAIVLKKRDVGETDRIYHVYTKEKGKVQARATGVRRSKAKLASHLENGTFVGLMVMKNRGMGQIKSAIAEQRYSHMKSSFAILSRVLNALDEFDKLVDLEEKDEQLFSLLMEFLETMDLLARENFEDKSFIIWQGFLFQLLFALGFSLEVGKCVQCQARLSGNQQFMSLEMGGALCRECARQSEYILSVHSHIIKLLRLFGTNNLSSLAKLNVSETEIRQLQRLSAEFIKRVKR